MAWNEPELVLASASPRRRELLEKFSRPFSVCPARGEEAPAGAMGPEDYVQALARAKAEEVAALYAGRDAVILAADTVVERDGRILGKPASPEDAQAMLRSLSGREHRVWTGLCVRRGSLLLTGAECTRVFFRPLTDREIGAYVSTGEPLDKAGAYGYQGLACLFVERIQGDYYNVVGLPLCRLGRMLQEAGVTLL